VKCTEKKVDTRDELLVNMLDVIACIKERQDTLRRTTRHVRKNMFIKSVLLRMTDTITSQKIDLSSWDTLCRSMRESIFWVLCDLLSYLRHDNRIYTIVMCKVLEHFPKSTNLSALMCHVPLSTTFVWKI